VCNTLFKCIPYIFMKTMHISDFGHNMSYVCALCRSHDGASGGDVSGWHAPQR
jgi:hypothetical protein